MSLGSRVGGGGWVGGGGVKSHWETATTTAHRNTTNLGNAVNWRAPCLRGCQPREPDAVPTCSADL